MSESEFSFITYSIIFEKYSVNLRLTEYLFRSREGILFEMKIHNKYIVRRPISKIEVINQIYDSNNLNDTLLKIIESDEFEEILLVASKSLYLELKKAKSSKLNKSLTISLIKYILRMSSRPMPFGLLSGLEKKCFKDVNNPEKTFKKMVRPSVKWINEVARMIEQRQTKDSHLKLALNNSVRIANECIYLEFPYEEGQKRIEIRKNNFIELLLKLIEKPISIREVINYFSLKGISEEKTLHQIKTLLKNNILLTSIRPSSNNERNYSLECLLQKGEYIDRDLYTKLKCVESLIKEYENCPLGKGIEKYFLIEKKMNEIVEMKNLLMVDLNLNSNKVVYEKDVYQFIEDIEFLNVFRKFSTFYIGWEDYCDRFWDKYGLFNEVKLLDLLDEDTGLGLPIISDNSRVEKEFNEYISTKIQESILTGNTVIKLDSKEIDRIKEITKYDSSKKIKDGFDVKFSYFEENSIKKVFVSENSFSNTPLSFTGRFNIHKDEMDCIKYEDPEYISAEISVVPNHYPDLGITNCTTKYQIDIDGNLFEDNKNITINLNDLYVGMDYNGMYLKSRSLNKRVLPVSTHMLFYSNFNEKKPLLFLSQFGDFISNTPKDFYLGIGEKLPFVPRVEYKNLVLSLKRWNLPIPDLNGQDLKDYIQGFINNYKVDKLVNLLQGDRKFPIRIDTSLGIELLIKEIKSLKSDYITLVEAPELNEKNVYNYDYIITVLPKCDREKKHIDNSHVNESIRMIPDFNWEYYKVYYKKGKRINTTLKLIDILKENNINKYFIVNYVDVSEHIRLRFKKSNSEFDMEKELKLLLKNNFIKNFSKNIFLPEISRYGGEELSKYAYEIFCLETELLYEMERSNLFKGKNDLQKGVMITIYTILDLFENYNEGLQFLDYLVKEKNKSNLKEFKSNREEYVNNGKYILDYYYTEMGNLQIEKRNKLRQYVTRLNKFNVDRKNYILLSLIHMTINRYLGVDRNLEDTIYEYSKYVFYNLGYTIKKYGESVLYV